VIDMKTFLVMWGTQWAALRPQIGVL